MAEWGKHKVPTLRNVDLRPTGKFVKAYSHNGYFKSLEEIVHFYNTRDVPGAGWPSPEVADNINTVEMGNLGLNHGEELAIVAFLGTLSDGYIPAAAVTASPTAAPTAAATAAATAAPTATAATLPASGGPPASGGTDLWAYALLALGMTLLGGSGLAFAFARKR